MTSSGFSLLPRLTKWILTPPESTKFSSAPGSKLDAGAAGSGVCSPARAEPVSSSTRPVAREQPSPCPAHRLGGKASFCAHDAILEESDPWGKRPIC